MFSIQQDSEEALPVRRLTARGSDGGLRVGGVIDDKTAPGTEGRNSAMRLKRETEAELRNRKFRTSLVVADMRAIESRLARIAQNCDILLAAGGDHVVGAAAHAARMRGKPLLVLSSPGQSKLARDLELPEGMSAADILADASVREIDLGVVNGRSFVNEVSFSGAADRRLWRPSLFGHVARVLNGSRWPWIRWREMGRRRWRYARSLLVSNNPVRPGTGAEGMPGRTSLTSGALGFYEAEGMDQKALVLQSLFGRARRKIPAVAEQQAREIFLDFPGPQMPAFVDGEQVMLDCPVSLSSIRGGLKLVVPAA